ncbi:hypothetical protein R9X47_08580 [Wukongibacter baidiensis]
MKSYFMSQPFFVFEKTMNDLGEYINYTTIGKNVDAITPSVI